MKTLASLALTLALVSSAVAGTPVTYSGKSPKAPMMPPPEPACFGAGFDFGLFGAGFLPSHKSSSYDDALGGGVLAEYFFNEYVGIQGSYAVFATDSEQHLFNGDLVVRYPFQSICIAPYIMAGGGYQVDGTSHGQYHAGAGIEARLKDFNKMAIFADGAYYWHGDGDRNLDFTMVRLGVKFEL